MKFPSIIQYLDSINAGCDFFKTLSKVDLCLEKDGHPIFASGNSGVVFKTMIGGRMRALKCFTRPSVGRAEAYRAIAGALPKSNYMIDYNFLQDEITAFVAHNVALNYPVVDMEWIDGHTLQESLVASCGVGDGPTIEQLSARFDRMALWLLDSPMAHGDLKPDNIIVSRQQQLHLIDYDAIYLPSMEGSFQREQGTPSYQHPLRYAMPFSKAIDHYSIALISLTLRALAFAPSLYETYGDKSGAGLLFNPQQLTNGYSEVFNVLSSSHLAHSELWQLVQSPTPELSGLEQALDQRLPTTIIATHYLSPFQKDGKWGFENLRGMGINPIYERASPFSEGLSAVKLGGKWSYIDTDGCAIAPFKFDDAWSFSESRGLVRKGSKYGYLDNQGRMAIAARYDFARNFSQGVAVAAIDGMYGFIDGKGKWKVKPVYHYAQSMRDGYAKVEKDGQEFTISLESIAL